MSDMRIVDFETGETLVEPDLNLGYLSEGVGIKEDAAPIDNETKFAWADDDYEQVVFYHRLGLSGMAEKAISELKTQLSETDYIAAKAMDALLSCESIADLLKVLAEFRAEYASKIAEREDAREKIRELEA